MCFYLVLISLVLIQFHFGLCESTILEYDSDLFIEQMQEMDGNFVLFYTPWCRHCKNFRPIWSELAELVNTKGSKFAIAQVDCTKHSKLCHEKDISGYPTLIYFRKSSTAIEYKGTRDLPSLTLFLSEAFSSQTEVGGKYENLAHTIDSLLELQSHTVKDKRTMAREKSNEVKIYSNMAYLTDQNIEKFISKGQHFVMFYAPWCSASQLLAPAWAELAILFVHNRYVQIGKLNCMENENTCKNFDIKQYPRLLWIANGRIMGVADANTLDGLQEYVERMLLTENHDPEKFMKKKKILPVARITEETFETFLEKDLVFINYFAPWCAHCMQLSPMWLKIGEKFQNESRILIADVDCVQSKAICEMEKITSLPTLILYKYKKIVGIENGGRPVESLVNFINTHLQQLTPVVEKTPIEDEQSQPKDEL